MQIRRTWFAVAAVALLCSAGCGGSFPVQIVDATPPPMQRSYRSLGWAEGESCQFTLFGLFGISEGGRMWDAYTLALKSKDADALIDVSADGSLRIFPLGLTRQCAFVKGEAVKFD